VGLFLGIAGQAQAQPTYTFTTLDVPGTLTTYNNLNGINASGQIVGWYNDADGTSNTLLLVEDAGRPDSGTPAMQGKTRASTAAPGKETLIPSW
jgi:hypothetical protein